MASDGSLQFDTKVNAEGFKGAMSSMEGMANKSFKAVAAGVASVGASLGTMGGLVIKFGSEFESAIAKTSTMFGDVNVNTAALNEQVLSLSSSTGVAASQIGESLYNALSAGIPVTEDMGGAMSYMEKNAMLAKAGFTDIDTAVTATAKVLNAYKMDVSETDKVHNILMQTQNKGITTVGELGSVLAQVTPTASAMNVSFEQVGAALATMTAQGTPTAQATTQLNSLFAELGKQGTKAQQALKAAAEGTEYAGMSFQDMMKAGVPLNEVLDMMDGYAQDSGMALLDMFGSLEAGNAALQMSGANMESYSGNLADMSTDVDLVGIAYEKVMDTLAGQTEIAVQTLKNMGISFYQDLEEPAKNAVKSLTQTLSSSSVQNSCAQLAESFGGLMEKSAGLAEKALPALVQAFAFLSEHLITIVRIAGSAYVAFEAFKIINSTGEWISSASKAFDIAAASLEVLTLKNGAAAASQAALNGQLTLGQLAVGVIQKKITIATAAQTIWNAVCNANPLVLLASAIAAVVVGIGIYNATAEKAVSATQKLIEEDEKLAKANKNLREEIESSSQKRQEEIKSFEAEAGAAQVLAGRLGELSDKTVKTATDKLHMSSLVKQLNEQFPELGLSIDKETGALNLSKEAILGVVDANLELVKAQAAQEDQRVIGEEIYKLDKKNNELLEKRAELTAALNEARNGGPNPEDAFVYQKQLEALNPEIEANTESLVKLHTEFDKASEYIADATVAAGELTGSAEESSEGLDGLGDSAEGLAKTTESASDRFKSAMESIGMSAEDAAKSMGMSIGDAAESMEKAFETCQSTATNAFSAIKQDSEISVEQMIQNLQKNQQAVAEWGDNLKRAAELGVNQGLLQQFRDAGPEMGLLLGSLVNENSDKIDEINALWASGIDVSDEAWQDLLKSTKTAMTDTESIVTQGLSDVAASTHAASSTINDAIAGKLEELPEKAGQAVSGTPESVAGGIAGNAPVTAAEGQVNDTVAAYSGMKDQAGAAVSGTDGVVAKGLSGTKAASAAQQSGAGITKEYERLPQQVGKALDPVPKTVDTTFGKADSAAEKGAASISDTTADGMKDVADAFTESTDEITDAADEWFSELSQSASSQMPKFTAAVMEPLKPLPEAFRVIGGQTVQGMWEGMSGQQGWLNVQVSTLISGVVTAAKAAADIHSPSRVMADEVGRPLALGVLMGMDESQMEVDAKANAWLSSMIEKYGKTAIEQIGLTTGSISDMLGSAMQQCKDKVLDAFSTIKESEELSVNDMVHNLRENQQAFDDWAEYLTAATERGVNQGFLQQFRDAGPSMNASLKNIVNASDTEIERLNAQCEKGMATYVSTYSSQLESLTPIVDANVGQVVNTLGGLPNQASGAVAGTGTAVAGQVAAGSGAITTAAQTSTGGAVAEYGKLPQAAATAGANANAQLAGALSSGTSQASGAAQQIVDSVATTLGGMSSAARTAGENAAAGFTEGIKAKLESAPPDFGPAMDLANNDALKAKSAEIGRGIGAGLSDAIKAQLTDTPPDFKTPLETAAQTAIDAADAKFAQLPIKISAHLATSNQDISNWMAQATTSATVGMDAFTSAVFSGLDRMDAGMADQLLSMSDAIRQWFTNQVNEANIRMPEFEGAITSHLAALPDGFREVGSQMVEGLWDGMDSMRGWLEGQIQSFVEETVKAAREAADIHSPSRLMARMVGAPLAEGVGVGFTDALPSLQGRIDAATGSIMSRVSVKAAPPVGNTATQIIRSDPSVAINIDKYCQYSQRDERQLGETISETLQEEIQREDRTWKK